MVKQISAVVLCVCLVFSCAACSSGSSDSAEYTVSETGTDAEGNESDENSETVTDEETQAEASDFVPTRDEVAAARETALEGMTGDEIADLEENIKAANLTMENAYLNQNIFGRLEDPEDLYWNYFDEKGEIQIGWAYDGSYDMNEIMENEGLTEDEFYEKYAVPVTVYNRFDAENFIELIRQMQETVTNEALRNDLQTLIDETQLAKDTHEMEHANNIYKLLHDLDYYLLRYGPDDVGIYTRDDSLVDTYYGTLSIYD